MGGGRSPRPSKFFPQFEPHRAAADVTAGQGWAHREGIQWPFHPNLKAVTQPGQLSPKRAVAGYLRSATQLEGDSLRKQLEAIIPYARDHDMQLIRVYCDECGSGLRRGGRSGLQQMFRDIESGAGDFDAVLLLDPSRWGRFQDPDQGACLEYACGTAGIEVHYCAEGLFDDQTPISTIVKSIKRTMAREYARELTNPKQRAPGFWKEELPPARTGTRPAARQDRTACRTMQLAPPILDRHPNKRITALNRCRSCARQARNRCADMNFLDTVYGHAGTPAADNDNALVPVLGDSKPTGGHTYTMRTQ